MLLFGRRLAAVQVCRRDNVMTLVLLEAWLLLSISFRAHSLSCKPAFLIGYINPINSLVMIGFAKLQTWCPLVFLRQAVGGPSKLDSSLFLTASGGLSLSRKHVSWALFLISFPHSQLASALFPIQFI